MEMLMQLWKPEFELDGINSRSCWYQCLLIWIYHWLWEGDCTAFYVWSSKLHGSETWSV